MVTYFTIGHELTHLVQPPGLALIPSGEVQCDIWTLTRDPLFLDEKPCYLEVSCDGRSWRRHAGAVRELCRRAIEIRRWNRRYIVWLREQLSAYFGRPDPEQPSLFDTMPPDAMSPARGGMHLPDPVPGGSGKNRGASFRAQAARGE